eukprot:CAMPEP_0174251022 /NCGR_PEP_ID=MMETSP0439-20130205/996_1 /TAXON_ID=0 /ORGANISM="Stereomyxa ramosa, Strain Chinc5" /LENGTH=238 /DNA_ID=CAMNT_0015331243 /DNA_START=117 /DNA_END=833 /DNA_ORIENTATION=+
MRTARFLGRSESESEENSNVVNLTLTFFIAPRAPGLLSHFDEDDDDDEEDLPMVIHGVILHFAQPGGEFPSLRPLGSLHGMSFSDFLDHTFHLSQSAGPPPASQKALKELPTISLTEAHLRHQPDCPVCQEAFDKNAKALQLPCIHHFHDECVKPWLSEHNTCPICRYELETEDSNYERDRKLRMDERDRSLGSSELMGLREQPRRTFLGLDFERHSSNVKQALASFGRKLGIRRNRD